MADQALAPCSVDFDASFGYIRRHGVEKKEESLARKTVLVSDLSGKEIAEGKGATIRITFHDARKGVRELDVTDDEAEDLGGKGRAVARRGRRPKSATTS
ncbi:MAG TPA: hypothetical protein VLB86_08740 [Gaiellaceae bacterium]|nr:hypothetical protein [Gaiellaceae bacterium]